MVARAFGITISRSRAPQDEGRQLLTGGGVGLECEKNVDAVNKNGKDCSPQKSKMNKPSGSARKDAKSWPDYEQINSMLPVIKNRGERRTSQTGASPQWHEDEGDEDICPKRIFWAGVYVETFPAPKQTPSTGTAAPGVGRRSVSSVQELRNEFMEYFRRHDGALLRQNFPIRRM